MINGVYSNKVSKAAYVVVSVHGQYAKCKKINFYTHQTISDRIYTFKVVGSFLKSNWYLLFPTAERTKEWHS